MIWFIAIQSTYHTVEIGLCADNNLLDSVVIPKEEASKTLLVRLQELLQRHSLSVQDIQFFAVNQGPGPFTTLRVVIATINGINYAYHTPLVGVDALKTFLLEQASTQYPFTIALLNAFNNDVYIGIEHKQIIKTECMNIETFLDEVKQQLPHTLIRFIGNGATLHQEEIKKRIGSYAYLPTPIPEYCSLQFVANKGLEQWKSHTHVTNQLLPLYLK